MSKNGHQLWCAVIDQAIIDATQPLSRKLGKRMDQLRTREWLTIPNKDFEEVCSLAGIDAERVRAVVTPRIEEVRKHDPELVQPKPKAGRRRRGVGRNFTESAEDRSFSSMQETR